MTTFRLFGAACVLLAAAVSCDTKVTNPGPVQDDFLSDRNSAIAMVNGAGRALGSAINWIGYTGAAITREIHPAGSTGSFGITNRWQSGELAEDDADLDTHWEQAQRARWVSEEAIRRLEAAGPPTGTGDLLDEDEYYDLLQLAYLYAGFSNRLLGENMCGAVIDGGPELPNATFFTRAESLFTKALAVTGGTASAAAEQTQAAYAGRAAARVFLDNWAGAVTDAGQVDDDFAFDMPFFDIGEDAQRNRIAWARGNTPYRAHTQWSTWYYDYSQATGDPRVPIEITTLQGDAAIECCGRVSFWPEAKHETSESPVRLASGAEMRLIEAENALRGGDFATAMGLINQVRSAAGTTQLTAGDLNSAWTFLKRERGIELWLEARRLGDFRRWSQNSTPGALDPLELPGANSHLARQDLCFPISRSERETNPNFP